MTPPPTTSRENNYIPVGPGADIADSFQAAQRALSKAGKVVYYPGKKQDKKNPSTKELSLREIKAFETAFKQLQREYEKERKYHEQYKVEVVELRNVCDAQQKELTINRRMFNKLSAEKKNNRKTRDRKS